MISDHIIPNGEYAPFYQGYIDMANNTSVKEGLVKGFHRTLTFFHSFPEDRWEFRYDTGKWSPKEILLHIIDTERVFSYRALTLARSENADLPGFDQDEFMEHCNADARSYKSLIHEFYLLRSSTIAQFEYYDDIVLKRTGLVNGGKMSVRAIGAIIHGHTEHHLRILRERYL